MTILWLLAAIWLSAAALLPLHILFKAMFRVHRRQEPTQAMRVLRGYLSVRLVMSSPPPARRGRFRLLEMR